MLIMFEYVVTANASAISAAIRMSRSVFLRPCLGAGSSLVSASAGFARTDARLATPPAATSPVAPTTAARLKKERRDNCVPSGVSAIRLVAPDSFVSFIFHLLGRIQAGFVHEAQEFTAHHFVQPACIPSTRVPARRIGWLRSFSL